MNDLIDSSRPLPIQFTHDPEGVRNATEWLKERMDDYRDVGHVLFEVFSYELWKHIGYKSFNDYCKCEFGITGPQAQKAVVESAKVVEAAITSLNGKIEGSLHSPRPEITPSPRPAPGQITPVEVRRKEREPDKPKREKPKDPDYGSDEYGTKVSYAGAREILAAADEMREARVALMDLRDAIDAAGKLNPAYYGRVKGQISEAFDTIRRSIDFTICNRVCPLCGSMGGKCRACIGTGVLSGPQYKKYLESQG